MTKTDKKLHEKLWASAQQLRANSSLKLNEISEPILGLIFLKFADVRFQKAKKDVEAERSNVLRDSGSSRVRPLAPEDFKAKGILYVPEASGYKYLMSLPENENIGKAINKAMEEIEEANKDLAGVLPQNYTSLVKNANKNNKLLLTLLKSFNQIPDDIKGDAFGGIYEFFLGQFALAEGRNGGEFFTAQPIVKLLVEVIEPYKGRIYDPACGSGGMFVQSANFVQRHKDYNSQVMDKITIYGQEKTSSTVNIAKMNLAIHGLSGKIVQANSYYENPFNSTGRFDFVLANPPFNVSGVDKNKQIVIDPKKIEGDRRFELGLPLTQKGDVTNANYLWAQVFANSLNSKGRAGFIMANSASDANYAEKDIRIKLIEEDLVDVMIAVGSNMFLNVTLSCTLWFFDKDKKNSSRKGKTLFINAQDIYTPIDRAHNTWTEEQIKGIADIVKRYRGETGFGKYEDIKGRCKVASLEEIKANNYSLNSGRYVEIKEKDVDNVDFETRMKELMSEFTILTQKAHKLEDKISKDWKKIL
ncbi:MAG: class I SAM-dependent DNA methyltransferase [Candidatus Shapirobacteria bacterium]